MKTNRQLTVTTADDDLRSVQWNGRPIGIRLSRASPFITWFHTYHHSIQRVLKVHVRNSLERT